MTASRDTSDPLGKGHTVYEVVLRRVYKGPELRAGGCSNRPPNQGCQPYSVPTGRNITIVQEHAQYIYSGRSDAWMRHFFVGRAPKLHRLLIGHRNARGRVQNHPTLRVARKQQFAAYEAFDAAARHPPDIRAALRINRAIATLYLKDIDRLREQVSALRLLDAQEKLNRKALQLDNALSVFDRVLARQWLLSDPCTRAPR